MLTPADLVAFALEERTFEEREWKRVRRQSVGQLLEEAIAIGGIIYPGDDRVVVLDGSGAHRYREGDHVQLAPEGNEAIAFHAVPVDGVGVVGGVLHTGDLVLERAAPRTGRVWVLPKGPLLDFYRWQRDVVTSLVGDETFCSVLRAEPRDCLRWSPSGTVREWAEEVSPRFVHALSLIQGPPGCGKTVLTAELARLAYARGLRVCVVTFTNRACDEVLRALVERASDNALSVYRLGNVAGWERELRGLGVRRARSAVPAGNFVLGTTLYKLNEAVAETKHGRPTFDFVFVDEASQVTLSMLAAAFASSPRVVLVGDQKQLGPVVHSPPSEFPGRESLVRSAFEYFLDRASELIFLPQTRRMLPAVCGLVSEAFYAGKLSSRISETEWEPPNLPEDTLRYASREPGIQLLQVPRGSQCTAIASPEEAATVHSIISFYERHLDATLADAERHFGHSQVRYLVSCFYRAQVALTRAVLAEFGGLVKVDTVERNQGQTCMVGFLSVGDAGGDSAHRDDAWRLDPRRFNVAVTRARVKSFVLASPDFIARALHSPEPASRTFWNALVAQLATSRAASREGTG